MKRIIAGILIVVVLLYSNFALAEERSEHHKTLLNILSNMSCKETNKEGIFEEAYYHEEKDIYVLTYEQPITKKEFDDLVIYSDNFLQKSSDLCREELCEYYMNWVDLINIDIDIVIRHVSTDGQFLYCMVNGVLNEKDVLSDQAESEKTFQDSILEMFSLMECDTEDDFILECLYNYQKRELTYNYKFRTLSKKQFDDPAKANVKNELEKNVYNNVYPEVEKRIKESMRGAEEVAEKNGVDFKYDRSQFDLIVQFSTNDNEVIVSVKNGEIEK